MKNNKITYVRKYNFLDSVFAVYENESTEYLYALRDALGILIKCREGISDSEHELENVKGYIRI